MLRILLLVLAVFGMQVSAPAYAVAQYRWSIGGGTYLLKGNTCGDFLDALGKSAAYVSCINVQLQQTKDRTAALDHNFTWAAVSPNYGPEYNASGDYIGPGPDYCEAPRFTGPDTSKPQGQQCERVACVEGDASGSYRINVAYTNEAGDVVQSIQHMDEARPCIDGCVARVTVASLPISCSRSESSTSGIYLGTCTANFYDTAERCVGNYDPEAPPAPYDPSTPPAGTCGGAGQPACPPTSTCGGAGQPACYPGGTCGAAGQPACTGGDGSGPGGTTAGGGSGSGSGGGATCGVAGKPACAPGGTCGGVDQPACAVGDGSGTAGSHDGCGGTNQPACAISGEGMPTTAPTGDLSQTRGKHVEGMGIIDGFSLGPLADWFPHFATAACRNPAIPNPITGGFVEMDICSYVDGLSILVSAIICFFFLLGNVRNIQDALKA